MLKINKKENESKMKNVRWIINLLAGLWQKVKQHGSWWRPQVWNGKPARQSFVFEGGGEERGEEGGRGEGKNGRRSLSREKKVLKEGNEKMRKK